MKKLTDSTTVQVLYDLLADTMGDKRAFTELTEGLWECLDEDKLDDYWIARDRQLNYLLDGVSCKTGSRILDVGCGNGSLLEQAKKRGASESGITLSPEQVKICKKRGVNARVQNYFSILEHEKEDGFDGIVMNGSMEHFVLAKDLLRKGADTVEVSDGIYSKTFDIAHKLLKQNGILAITVISINFDPREVTESLYRNPWWLLLTKGRKHFHFAMLAQGMGGYYPTKDQLDRAFEGKFRVIEKHIANSDYIRTSNFWVKDVVSVFINPMHWPKIFKHFIKNPAKVTKATLSLLPIVDSWRWQFGKIGDDNPPTHLYRYILEKI